jgi:hypothetical protein
MELSRFIVSEAPVPVLMQRIAETAVSLLPRVASASVTFTRGDSKVWTAATTGELATLLEEAQYAIGNGPCMDAASGGEILLIRDFAAEDRWPDYAPIALAAGAHSSLRCRSPSSST